MQHKISLSPSRSYSHFPVSITHLTNNNLALLREVV
jgi:hypothetical protein